MKKLFCAALALLVTSCATPREKAAEFANSLTFQGNNPKIHTWVNDGDASISVKSQLFNNTAVTYTKLKATTFPAGYTDVDNLRIDVDSPFFKDKGILFDAEKIKTRGPFTYYAASSANFNCFLYYATFGNQATGYNQRIGGNGCFAVTVRAAESFDAEMLDLLDRMLVDGHPIVKD